MKRIHVVNLELIQRKGWLKVRGTVWIEGKGGKSFEKPIMYVGRKR